MDDCDTNSLDTRGLPGTQCSVINNTAIPLSFDGCFCYYELDAISDEVANTLPTLEFTNGEKPYEPGRRYQTRRLPTKEEKQFQWKQNLAFPPDQVIAKTLLATTQLVPTVEAETREIMRDHLAIQIPELHY